MESKQLPRQSVARIIASDLRVSRGGRPILNGVDFCVSGGSSVALVGPSGSGKSTLMSLLGGLDRADAGSVEGRFGPEVVDPRWLVSWVPQSNIVLTRRSVIDNVLLSSNSRGRNRRADTIRAGQLLSFLGLGSRVDERVGRLSGGERQRVAIVRALIQRTPFVFADEPTGHLDTDTSSVVGQELIEAATAAQQGVLIATHDLKLAETCDRVVHLVDGRLRQPRESSGG